MTTLNFGVIKVFKSTLYTRHKVDLELNFGRTYSFSWKFQNMVWINSPSSMSRENSPLICAYKFSWIPSTHIYIFETFDGVFPTSGNRGIQDTRYIWYEILAWLAQPHNHKMNIKDKSSTNYHSSSHITSQMFKSKHKSQTEFMQDTNHEHVMQ